MRSHFFVGILIFLALAEIRAQSASRYAFTSLPEGCCFSFGYVLNDNDPAFNAVEIRLPNGLDLNLLEIDFTAGWFVEDLFFTNGYRFYRSDFGPIPDAESSLFQLCIDNNFDPLTGGIEVRWYINSTLLARDSSDLVCTGCNIAFQDSIICSDSSGYEFWIRFINGSDFQIDELYVEGEGLSMASVEASELLINGGVAVGEESEWLLVPLNGSAEQSPEVCLDISSRRYEDILRLECCRSSYCTELPVCDRCCQDEVDFVNDVAQGFQVILTNEDSLCEMVGVQVLPRQLTACDTTLISLRYIDATNIISLPGRGNQSGQFNGVDTTGSYEICMQVTRVNFDQEACFQDSTLTFCDTIFIGCAVISSLAEYEVDAINVYPNPARNELWLADLPAQQVRLATLVDLKGRILKQTQFIDRDRPIFQLADLPAGIYLLLLENQAGVRYRKRIIKL